MVDIDVGLRVVDIDVGLRVADVEVFDGLRVVGLNVGFCVVGLNVGLRIVGLVDVGSYVVGSYVVGSLVGFGVLHDMEPQRHSAGNSEPTMSHADASLRHWLFCNHMILDPQLKLPVESVTILSQTVWVHELQPQYEVGVGEVKVGGPALHNIESQRHTAGNSEATFWQAAASLEP